MGRKKLERPSAEAINSQISSMLVPSHILLYFEIWDAHEYSDRWVIEMRESEGHIPSELSGFSDVVFDGYSNPLEVLSHSFVCKPIWLKLYAAVTSEQVAISITPTNTMCRSKVCEWFPSWGFF